VRKYCGIKICTLAPNIFGIITAVSPLPVHMHRAQSARQQWRLQDGPELWVVSTEPASCHPSGAWDWLMAVGFVDSS